MAVCHGCEEPISDQFILRVSPDLQWHSSCLRCSECHVSLSGLPSCYVKNGKPFCKNDYEKLLQVNCQGCNTLLDKDSLVMKANGYFFHVDCFNCFACNERLLPGDQFSISSDGQVFCQSDNCTQDAVVSSDDSWSDATSNVSTGTCRDLATSIDLENTPSPNNSIEKAVKTDKLIKDGKPRVPTATRKNCKDKPTRVRTVLNEKQLSTLKRCYAANPRPDSVMKEQLVDMTGLSPRVIRVWFQNKRCKDKKRMMMNGGDGKIGDMLQNHISMHTSPLSDELSLPVCSPPLPTGMQQMSLASMTTHVNSYADHTSSSIRLLTSHQNFRDPVPYSGYGMWNKYGDYQCSYQDSNVSNSHYQQLVS